MDVVCSRRGGIVRSRRPRAGDAPGLEFGSEGRRTIGSVLASIRLGALRRLLRRGIDRSVDHVEVAGAVGGTPSPGGRNLILASRHDRTARRLADAWESHGARLLTADDLSVAGWRLTGTRGAEPRVVVEGEVMDAGAVSGVVTRLPGVRRPRDVGVPGLLALDPALPDAEPAGGVSLCGPDWRVERWLRTGRHLGILVRPQARRVPRPGQVSGEVPPLQDDASGSDDHVTVTVVGDRCSWSSKRGGEEEDLANAARALATAALRRPACDPGLRHRPRRGRPGRWVDRCRWEEG